MDRPDANQPVVLLGGLDHLLDAMDVRGEGSDDDPALGPLEDLLQRLAHDALEGT